MSKSILSTTVLSSFLLAGSMLVFTGCATNPTTANTVRRNETGVAHSMEMGRILEVRAVTIQGETEGIGGVAGGVMGLALGNAVGRGRGQTIGRVGGTLAGAAVGTAVETGITTREGVELTVQLESGEVIVVLQGADAEFQMGDPVRVIRRAGGGVRVVPTFT